MVTIQRSQSKLTVSFSAFTLFLLPSYTCRVEHKYLNFHLSPNRIGMRNRFILKSLWRCLSVISFNICQLSGPEETRAASKIQLFISEVEVRSLYFCMRWLGRENYSKPYSGNKWPFWRHYIRKDYNTRLSPPPRPTDIGHYAIIKISLRCFNNKNNLRSVSKGTVRPDYIGPWVAHLERPMLGHQTL